MHKKSHCDEKKELTAETGKFTVLIGTSSRNIKGKVEFKSK